MFSKGTFNLYLFEIETTQKRMSEVYEHLAGQLRDAAIRKAVTEFGGQIAEEQKTVAEIRTVLQSLS